jgi:predicted NBD/HSP70 family sugar kinase/mannose-6-phosphate isomerase class I
MKVIGVDIGGSHISAGLIDLNNGMLIPDSYREISVNSELSAIEILTSLIDLIKELVALNPGKTEGIGIAVPGPFDYAAGIAKIRYLGKYDQLFGINLKQVLLDEFKDTDLEHIEFINDAEAFALGEYWCGAAEQYEDVLAITLGTGFGSTFIRHGKVLKYGDGIPSGGFLYNQQYKREIADNCFSTSWFKQRWLTIKGEQISGVETLFNYATEGMDEAIQLFHEFGANLAEFLGPWLESSEMECLVIGGKIAKSMSFFGEILRSELKMQGIHIPILESDPYSFTALSGAILNLKGQTSSEEKIRLTSQLLIPNELGKRTKHTYEIYPSFTCESGSISSDYRNLAKWISKHKIIVIDGYAGVLWDDLRKRLSKELRAMGKSVLWHEISAALKSDDLLDEMIAPCLGGDDPIFGKRTMLSLKDFFDEDLLSSMQADAKADINIVIGTGAALIAWQAPLIYVDLPKNELQFRMRAGRILNLGATKADLPKLMYKRFYFVDWPVLNKHKCSLISRMDIIIDDQRPTKLMWMEADAMRDALKKMSTNLFRVRPWFEPGPWGGQWMKDRIEGLTQDVPNYAWSFELIVPENGLLLEDAGKLLEISFDMLMYLHHENVLGEASDRFGYEFPIRFDFLDTFDGGNLSIQCHPKESYISKHFGENFTQDETYYILDTKENAQVYLGFNEDIDPLRFRNALEESFKNSTEINVERFVQRHDSYKHDLFLIPNSTIHGSGTNNLVLEISSTPYIFTFKLYDWLRLDLDGNPRPLNIERGFNNLDFSRKGDRVKQEFISSPALIDSGSDWQLYHLPTHEEHFYDVHRYHFMNKIEIATQNQCHILMLVEGSSIQVETASGMKQQFNYAETFVVPAAAESYRIINSGSVECMVIKAFVKSDKV